MLLQAASLYHLANVLINSKTPDFLVQAIYITEQFQAEEYTLFRTETQGKNDHNQLVILQFCCPNRWQYANITIENRLLYLRECRLNW